MRINPPQKKSLLQHHSSKASILRCSAFFTVQLSHPYMTTGKTTALTRWTFVGKVMSLLFNMLSRLIITFLPWSRIWQPASIFLPGEFHGQRSLVPWGHKELDMSMRTHILLHVTLEWVSYTSSVSEVGKYSSHAVNSGQCREERNTCDQVIQMP